MQLQPWTNLDIDRHRQTQIDIDRHRQTQIDIDRHRQTQIDIAQYNICRRDLEPTPERRKMHHSGRLRPNEQTLYHAGKACQGKHLQLIGRMRKARYKENEVLLLNRSWGTWLGHINRSTQVGSSHTHKYWTRVYVADSDTYTSIN